MFLPIKDFNPKRNIKFQYVTFLILMVNIGLFLAIKAGLFGVSQNTFIHAYGFIPEDLSNYKLGILGNEVRFSYSPYLISYMFLHVSWLHLLSNMSFLYVLGDNVEDVFGHITFLIFYILSGIFAGVFHGYIVSDSDAVLVGASGAISAVITAYMILYPRVVILALFFLRVPIPLPAFLLLGLWIVMQIYFVLSSGDDPSNMVSWSSHIGGIIIGSLTSFTIIIYKKLRSFI